MKKITFFQKDILADKTCLFYFSDKKGRIFSPFFLFFFQKIPLLLLLLLTIASCLFSIIMIYLFWTREFLYTLIFNTKMILKMKKSYFTTIGIMLFFCLSTFCYAGDFHRFSTLVCSDCHVMHGSKSHQYDGSSTPDTSIGGLAPYSMLLKNNENELCLSCHDGKANNPDVRGGNTNSYIRAAGAINVLGDSGTYAENKGHTLGITTPPPGGMWSGNSAGGLKCSHCHDVHGNKFYRNLTKSPGNATGKKVTYSKGSGYSGTKAIQQISSSPLSTHYAASNIFYRQTTVGTTDDGLSEWCSGCHDNIHGQGGNVNMGGSASGDTASAGDEWLRHPTRDVTMSEGSNNKHIDSTHWFSSLSSRVPVVSPSGVIPGTSTGSDNEVFCGSCHKAHGSDQKFGLLYDNDSTSAREDGSSMLQTCQQCHYK